MPESAAGAAPEPTVAWHGLTPTEALERQGVTVAEGLAAAEVDTRRATYGPPARRPCPRPRREGIGPAPIR